MAPDPSGGIERPLLELLRGVGLPAPLFRFTCAYTTAPTDESAEVLALREALRRPAFAWDPPCLVTSATLEVLDAPTGRLRPGSLIPLLGGRVVGLRYGGTFFVDDAWPAEGLTRWFEVRHDPVGWMLDPDFGMAVGLNGRAAFETRLLPNDELEVAQYRFRFMVH